ncbi:restriction endonuclease subunit S [Acinetobacter indicus]|nr:restriction endonuclease subunit S [Acinetobacter indicus]
MAAPKLRFKEFDGDWNKSTIGNFVLNYKGGASLTPADFVEYSDCEVIPKKAISSGGLLQLDKVVPTFCTLEFFNSNQNYIVDSEYLITTLRDLVPSGPSIGYIVKYESNKKYILAQGVYGFRIKNDLNRDFLIQFSNTSKFRLHMQSIMVGSTQVHIRNQDYFSTELYTPSLIEQTKIASFLSNVDEKINQLTQKHELLSQYKQGMMQKLFSQQLRFKADDGSEFVEWEDKPLNEIASKRSGKNKDGSISEVLTNSATQGIIKQSDYFEREIVTESNLNGYYIVNLDDFVYNPRISVHAPVGPIKRNKKCLGVMSPLYTVFTVVEGNLAYLEYFFDSNFWHDYVKGVANSGARHDRMNITNKDFFDMPILYPCLEEQTKIANFLSAIDQKIEVVAQQIEQAKLWKKGLLQQMFV